VGKKVRVRVPTEDRCGYGTKIIERVPKAVPFGNFQMLIVRWNSFEYLIGDGDEYLRGMPEEFELGRKLKYVGR